MRSVGLIALFFIVLASIANGQIPSGAYTTQRAGREMAKENYRVSSLEDGNIKAEADVSVGGVPAQKIAMTLNSAYKPISFSQAMNGRVMLGELSGSTAKLITAGQPERLVSTNATAILENLVWSHYIFLLLQYDASKGGRQSFSAFLPSGGRTISVKIERMPASAVSPQIAQTGW